MIGRRPRVSRCSLARTRVDRSNSGAPDRPPVSPDCGSESPLRDRVVLVAISPSTPLSSTTAASSASAASSMSGAILTKTGGRAPDCSRAVRTPESSAASACAPCRSRSFSVLGELTFTVRKSATGAQRRVTSAKSAARSVLSLFAPMLRPTGTPPRLRAASRSRIAAAPSLLKPKRLMIARSPGSRNRRGCGLPGCGRGVAAPTSTNPKPARVSASTARAFLS